MLRYAFTLTREDGAVLVVFPDFPGVNTFGDDEPEAMARAVDALKTAASVGKAELARRLHCHLPQVDRLLKLSHASRLDQLEQAFLALGKRLTLALEDAA